MNLPAVVLLALSCVWALTVAYLITHAVRQYAAYEKLSPASPPPAVNSAVAVIVPARNEEKNISRCLESVLQQDYPKEQLRIVAVNDNSTDNTAKIIGDLARSDNRLHMLEGGRLPEDWKGKPFACWQAVQDVALAEPANSLQWLCFIDADTTLRPQMLRTAISAAESRRIDMLSLEPFQILGLFWDRLIIPAGFFLAAFSQDLRQVNNPDCSDAFANGQCILIRKQVYSAVGGHASVRGEISEDSALARLVKRSGYRLMVLGGESLMSTRMYTDFSSLWEGIVKNLIDMVGSAGKTLFFAIAAIVLSIASVGLPIWAWTSVSAHGADPLNLIAAILATAGTASMLGVQIGGAVYFKIPFWYGLFFPFAYMIGAVLALDSLRRRLRGHVAWKGRVYSPATK